VRSIRHALAVTSLVAAIGLFGGSPASAKDTHQISMVKNCQAWPPTCVITSSRPLGFLTGGVITYLDPPSLGTPAGTDVRVVTRNGRSSAPGHCRFDWTALPAPAGLCTFTSGTGALTGFSARLDVGWIVGTADFTLIGTYRFDRRGDSDSDDND
jgi:hypothetical protein